MPPLFNLAGALSCELQAAYQLRDILSELEAIQNLAETHSIADTLDKITVGIAADPMDGEAFDKWELDQRHFIARVYAEVESSHLAGLGQETVGNPREGGVFLLYLRRQVRDTEERSDVYSFFWDRVSAIGPALILASETDLVSDNNYRFADVERIVGPAFGERRTEGEQGAHLLALLSVTWGDIERG